MPIDPDVLAEHIRHSRLVHHVTLRAALPSIRERGLVPGSELGHRLHGGFHQTREGHVYLSNLLTVGVVDVPGERALLAVDLSQLDPELIDPDEDAVQDSYFHRGGGWLGPEHPPPERKAPDGVEAPGQGGALARWADETDGFDAPEITAKSLAAGKVA